jgi:hypothetical protein
MGITSTYNSSNFLEVTDSVSNILDKRTNFGHILLYLKSKIRIFFQMVLHIRKVMKSKFPYKPIRSTKTRPAIDELDRPAVFCHLSCGASRVGPLDASTKSHVTVMITIITAKMKEQHTIWALYS